MKKIDEKLSNNFKISAKIYEGNSKENKLISVNKWLYIVDLIDDKFL